MKKQQQHTPGPWSYENEGQTVYVGDQIEGQWIAQVRGWGWLQKLKNGEAVQDANARLIASSPDLLEALIMCCQSMSSVLPDFNPFDQAAYDKARAAIAKATGG